MLDKDRDEAVHLLRNNLNILIAETKGAKEIPVKITKALQDCRRSLDIIETTDISTSDGAKLAENMADEVADTLRELENSLAD